MTVGIALTDDRRLLRLETTFWRSATMLEWLDPRWLHYDFCD